MILLLALPAGLALGLLRGGRLVHVATLQLHLAWVALPAAALQMLLILLPPVPPAEGPDPLRLWLPLTFLPLAVFVLVNRRLPGVTLIGLGLAANAAVILANGGLMPTNEAALVRAGMDSSLTLAQTHPGIRLPRSKDVLLPRDQTHLWLLSDILVSPPFPRPKILSPGDLLVGGGLAWLVAQATRRGAPASAPSISTATSPANDLRSCKERRSGSRHGSPA